MVKKKDEIPDWVTDEIQNAKFKKPEELKRSGYVLEIYEADMHSLSAQISQAIGRISDSRHYRAKRKALREESSGTYTRTNIFASAWNIKTN